MSPTHLSEDENRAQWKRWEEGGQPPAEGGGAMSEDVEQQARVVANRCDISHGPAAACIACIADLVATRERALKAENERLRVALDAARDFIGNGYQPPALMEQIRAALDRVTP